MGKRIALATKVADVEAGTVTFRFADGSTEVIGIDEIPPETARALILHGIEQKGGDSYAGAAEAVEAGEATDKVSWAKAQLIRVLSNLRSGVWASREPAGPSRLARAIAEVTGKPVDEVAAQIAAWEAADDERLAKVKASPKVKAVLARMEREARERREAALAKAAAGSKDDISGLMG